MTRILFLLAFAVILTENARGQGNQSSGEISAEQTRDLSSRMWRALQGNYSVVATVVDAKGGSVRLRKQDNSLIKVPIKVLCEADRKYLRDLAWSGSEGMPLHEALARKLISVRTEDYAQQRIILLAEPRGSILVPRVTVKAGTWIELDKHPKAGRIYLAGKSDPTEIDVTSGGGRVADKITGRGMFLALPADPNATVPVIETARVGATKYEKRNHSQISRAGYDPFVGHLFGSIDPLNQSGVLSLAAAMLMKTKPDFDLADLQNYATKQLTERTSQYQERFLVGKRSSRSALYQWDATAEQWEQGQHLFEKVKFELAKSDPDTLAGQTMRSGASPGTESGPIPIGDAIEQGYVTTTSRKGLDRRLILQFKRTAKAPAGPLQLSVPVGTVLMVDVNNGIGPIRLYPLYGETINLFGSVESGAQLPVLYGTYKRKIKSTRPLAVTVQFEPKIEELFRDRPESHYAQMAVEAVLIDRDDLDRDQIQYHMNLAGVPGTHESLSVTDELVAAARARIAGDKTALAATNKPIPTTTNAPKTETNRKPNSMDGRTAQTSSNVAASETKKTVSEEDKRTANLLGKMREFAPESPEKDLVGTWISVSDSESRRFVEPMLLNRMEQFAVAQGKTLSADEKRMVKMQSDMMSKALRTFSAKMSFDADGTLDGTLTDRKSGETQNLGGQWSYKDAGVFSINLNVISPSFDFSQLSYVADGHLGCLGTGRGAAPAIIVLKKDP